MTQLRLTQVDAFADRPFTGNPAAVVPLEEWLPDEILQAIAEENNLSETAFTVPCADGEADYALRWFTPTVEVALCGHATLASGHVLIGDRERIRFRTRRAGLLEVARDGEGYNMSLPAYRAEPKPLPRVLAALGAAGAAETRWHEGRYALVVFEREEEVRALAPDFRALAAEGDILTICTAPASATDVMSRVFAAGAGIDEDPVTGSAHSVLAPYWAERLGRAAFSAYQASRRGGHVACRLEGDRAILGGRCVTVLEGVLTV
ncbi:MAG: PhzF family phenazine biosynthesis protein [Alphaproteobacteria bacterium]|nr:PhzF family phenazine biosynthesis protein [Alphaproteobacteria bacterium]MBV9371832.1 PhzF family phenazine biosynthesis protein [Alphaproteobacteria bacterium]MBV9900546.1 PhzF family phenazine biosynthesis protein [Alphaproteobacteria bacterium]